MSSRRDRDRLRPRRPQIIQDDYSDSEPSDNNDNYYNGNRSRPSGRPRPPPDDDRDNRAPLHTRPRSKVRLKEPVVSSDSETTARRQVRGPRRPTRDLERKNSVENDMFRSRRDGYLSDEGEALKKSRRDPRPRRMERDTSDSDRRDNHRRDRLDPALLAAGGAGGAAGAALPLRRNPRAKSMDQRAPYPDDGYDAAPRRPRRPEYDTDGPVRRRTTRGEPRPRYDDYDDEPSPRRRGGGRPPMYDDRDRGYRSDHGGRRRDDGYGYAERDSYDRRGGRGDGYRSDHGPSRRDPYDDPRGGGRRDRYGDSRRADPYDDYGRRDRARSAGGKAGKGKALKIGGFKLDERWQKGATDAFLMYGLPYLKKEGPRWAKQASDYWAKSRGA